MNSKEISEKFLQIEDELDLFKQKIEGVYFWERVRFVLHRQILEIAGITGQAHTKLEHTLINMTKSALCFVKNLVIKNPYFVSKKDILFYTIPRRKLGEDGKWWDIYCDPIIENLQGTYAYFESAQLNRHLVPPKTDYIRYMDFLHYVAAAKRKLRFYTVNLVKSERILLQKIQDFIYSQFSVEIDLEKEVVQDLTNRKSSLPFYKKLLEKINPKLIIVICSYGNETFIEACKIMKIPVVELQHGVVNYYHFGYSFPGQNRTKWTFPDFFFAFGDFWKNCVEYPITKERIYCVGFPYLEREAKKYINVPKKEQLCFISQGTIGKELSKFAVELSKRKHLHYEIAYKLHPGEYNRWQNQYPWLLDAEIKVIDNDNIPLYRLFAESKAQIGVYSTAIYEGLIFKLRTYLINFPGIEYMEYLIDNQYATIIRSVDELVSALEDRKHSELIDTENFFTKNSMDKIFSAIDDIISSYGELYGP